MEEQYKTHKPNIHNEGLWATHDQACAVCHENPAVIDCDTEVFKPCWKCQKSGWELTNNTIIQIIKKFINKIGRK